MSQEKHRGMNPVSRVSFRGSLPTACGWEPWDLPDPLRSPVTCSRISLTSAAQSAKKTTWKKWLWRNSHRVPWRLNWRFTSAPSERACGELLQWSRVCAAFLPDGAHPVGSLLRFGGLAWMPGMFYGIGTAVSGIITRSAIKDRGSTRTEHGNLIHSPQSTERVRKR